MLSSITIENFKSYRKATLHLAPLTVLIGANASGKSNAIEALRLLSWIARGNRPDASPFQTNGYRNIRGTPGQLVPGSGIHFGFECHAQHPQWDRYSIRLCTLDDQLRIVGETLGGQYRRKLLIEVKYREERRAGELRAKILSRDPGGRLQVSFNDQVSVLIQVQSMPKLDRPPREAPVLRSTAAQYQRWLSDMVFLDPYPAAMREYSRKRERQLASDGRNISAVLYNIRSRAKAKEELLGLIGILPEQEVQDIAFIETPRDEVMVQLTECFAGTSTNTEVTLLSDGPLRVLAVAAAVLSAPRGALVVIEEMEAGVHPSRARQLLEQVSGIARRRGVRILTTSHDPALLDAVPNASLLDIVFCYRDPETGSSSLTRLGDLPRYPELIVQGGVGQLMTRGVLERFVKDRTSPEERRRRALARLDDLRAATR